MESVVKQEIIETTDFVEQKYQSQTPKDVSVIDLSSSASDYSDDDQSGFSRKRSGFFDDSVELFNDQKKSRTDDDLGVILPLGFLDPLPPDEPLLPLPEPVIKSLQPAVQSCRQFWKAGDYEGNQSGRNEAFSGGMDHVRVHPRFLHSNATSHKWALGAFAELLDNSLDEVLNGATYVKIEMLANKKDGTRMLLIEDNGGGMDPDKMRQCMSLGYSAKSKLANTIGQYGNGFKTSTMRLGADVIVFSCCRGRDGSPTQSIGMLSYTFLRSTGKEDIVVPMLDYENGGQGWNKLIRSSPIDWIRNVETIVQWSPYSSEADLLHQFNYIKDQGTRIIIYNIWEDDQGELELDFDADPHDIQIRGANRDEKNIQMAQQFPNSRHFLTYRHSLRSYASILYLRLPAGFKMILCGKEIEHHNIVNDMMLTQEITYRPQPGADGVPKDANMVAVVTLGFVKDAKDHIDVQGFNVYHKNRLIKPFWRVWNAAGSDGRGVIGVLEANFVEPAHDKQGFERTTVLARLETRLIQMQKTYWSTNCHKVGYAARCKKKFLKESSPVKETSPPETKFPSSSSQHSRKAGSMSLAVAHVSRSPNPPYNPVRDRHPSRSNHKQVERRDVLHIASLPMVGASRVNGHASISPQLNGKKILARSERKRSLSPQSSGGESAHETQRGPHSPTKLNENRLDASRGGSDRIYKRAHSKAAGEKSRDTRANEPAVSESDAYSTRHLEQENQELKGRIKDLEDKLQFERDRVKSLEGQLLESEQKLEAANKEQEALIDIFSEERNRRDIEEETLRKKLKDASHTIQELLEKQKSAFRPGG